MIDEWTWREIVASWIHQIAYWFCPLEEQDILIRDVNGTEIFSVAFVGGFVASGPVEPYTAHSREYANESDMVGTITDW